MVLNSGVERRGPACAQRRGRYSNFQRAHAEAQTGVFIEKNPLERVV
jgi:hypothetical protein